MATTFQVESARRRVKCGACDSSIPKDVDHMVRNEEVFFGNSVSIKKKRYCRNCIKTARDDLDDVITQLRERIQEIQDEFEDDLKELNKENQHE